MMKIGIFDSGLGGLIIVKAIRKAMPQYDYVYLGDTKRVPYGNRSYETVYEFTRQAVGYLFEKENCGLVILACNTVSARALRRIQQEYLPNSFPERRILGVLIPAAEEAAGYKEVGVLATVGTVSSKTFIEEIKKINNKTKVYQNAAPMLVPLIEEGETVLARPFIVKYLKPLLAKNIDALVLGCTHYPMLKKEIKRILSARPGLAERGVGKGGGVPSALKVVSQDEIIPRKLQDYLERHPDLEKSIGKNGRVKILFTDLTPQVEKITRVWFTRKIKPKLIKI